MTNDQKMFSINIIKRSQEDVWGYEYFVSLQYPQKYMLMHMNQSFLNIMNLVKLWNVIKSLTLDLIDLNIGKNSC